MYLPAMGSTGELVSGKIIDVFKKIFGAIFTGQNYTNKSMYQFE